jgi:hypothetical protein
MPATQSRGSQVWIEAKLTTVRSPSGTDWARAKSRASAVPTAAVATKLAIAQA